MALYLGTGIYLVTAHGLHVYMCSGKHVPACLFVFPWNSHCTLASAPFIIHHREPALCPTFH